MAEEERGRWLNRNVLGMGITSFFSDFGHEMATAILPMFLLTIGGSAAALGVIEGIADAVSSFVKLGAGWYSDRIGRRKPIVTLGYLLTAVAKASFALATAWPHLLWGRTVGWFGRGIRGPLRDAMLADSVGSAAYGRAFGFHRAADTLGAVVGPLTAFALVGLLGYRQIFWLTLIPGAISVGAIAVLVREPRGQARRALKFTAALRDLPASFRRFLLGVGAFGLGDFAHSLLTLRAAELLTPAMGAARAGQAAVLFYTLHNLSYAVASYPVGSLGDRIGKRGLLALGYLLAAVMGVGLMVSANPWALLGLFPLGGVYLAMEEALEGALAAELLPAPIRGTGYGLLATVNGVGDLVSSLVVGGLLAMVGPGPAFGYSAVMSVLGAALILRLR